MTGGSCGNSGGGSRSSSGIENDSLSAIIFDQILKTSH